MRLGCVLVVLGVLGACSNAVPDSGSGIGFDTSDDARRARELALNGGAGAGVPITPPAVVSGERLPQGAPMAMPGAVPVDTATVDAPLGAAMGGSDDDIARDTAAALAATSPGAQPVGAPVPASVQQPGIVPNNPGLSTENDFAAVSEQRSIEGDAARIARTRAQYEVVQPTAVPARTGGAGPNIVTYALETSHPRGTRMYSRSGINLANRAQRACAGYASPDQAQMEFLASGGPERDRHGLDPDGDGYACSWNPAPFRAARQN
ncbi:hypothetical protein [Arenibacterium halophilum]|uniref:Excalibur calcium-binding domain-containing protein n=1 Tax=Arenibacterium halophilum TaxID=2583821 RepID=A0ABY2X8V7_9RHOB|nr:hypothetical protein [Arenibacterium halophilum]TMV11728.1 hypothetical protein FGK64_15785 [Arenibacterium halophilum]